MKKKPKKSISPKKNEYDLDLTKSYYDLDNLTMNLKDLNHKMPKSLYLGNMKTLLENCSLNSRVDVKYNLKHGKSIIVNDLDFNYFKFLGFALISYDIHKIHSFLDYQYAAYKGKEVFPYSIESSSYEFAKKHSPFDNESRLATIMDWVSANRKFISNPERSDVKKRKGGGTEVTFKDYLKNKGDKFFKFLVKNYSDLKPKKFACFIYSLVELEQLDKKEIKQKLTKFHSVSESAFGKIGTREALRINLINLGELKPGSSPDVSAIKEQIQNAL